MITVAFLVHKTVLSCYRLWSHCTEDGIRTTGDDFLRHSGNPTDAVDDHESGRVYGVCLPLPVQEHLLRPVLYLL